MAVNSTHVLTKNILRNKNDNIKKFYTMTLLNTFTHKTSIEMHGAESIKITAYKQDIWKAYI